MDKHGLPNEKRNEDQVDLPILRDHLYAAIPTPQLTLPCSRARSRIIVYRGRGKPIYWTRQVRLLSQTYLISQ